MICMEAWRHAYDELMCDRCHRLFLRLRRKIKKNDARKTNKQIKKWEGGVLKLSNVN